MQADVLAHAATKLFVTQARSCCACMAPAASALSSQALAAQGGINSVHEAAMHAVPCLVIPLVAEQPDNARSVSMPRLLLAGPPPDEAAVCRWCSMALASPSHPASWQLTPALSGAASCAC